MEWHAPASTRIKEWVDGGAPVDHEWARVKAAAEDKAEEGTPALEAFWKTLSREHKQRLQGDMANLKSIARAADEENANMHTSFESTGMGQEPVAAMNGAGSEPKALTPAERNSLKNQLLNGAGSVDRLDRIYDGFTDEQRADDDLAAFFNAERVKAFESSSAALRSRRPATLRSQPVR
jgi:hypothetical protein